MPDFPFAPQSPLPLQSIESKGKDVDGKEERVKKRDSNRERKGKRKRSKLVAQKAMWIAPFYYDKARLQRGM